MTDWTSRCQVVRVSGLGSLSTGKMALSSRIGLYSMFVTITVTVKIMWFACKTRIQPMSVLNAARGRAKIWERSMWPGVCMTDWSDYHGKRGDIWPHWLQSNIPMSGSRVRSPTWAVSTLLQYYNWLLQRGSVAVLPMKTHRITYLVMDN